MGKPFDVSKPALRMLHELEFVALCVCWGTFWAGLLFFLGREKVGSVTESVFIFMSSLLVLTNLGYLVASGAIFVRAYLRDRRKIKERRATARASSEGIGAPPPTGETSDGVPLTAVVPVKDKDARDSDVPLEIAAAAGASHDQQHAATVDSIRHEHQIHEDNLKREHSRRQAHARRQTQLRLIARLQVKQTKALHKVPAFSGLDQDSLSRIVDAMSYKKVPAGTVVCREGELADEFHVCVTGSCAVSVRKDETNGEVRVGTITSLQFFGETAFGARSDARRGATVTAESETVQLLSLKRKQFARLVATGVVNRQVIDEVRAVHEQREAANRRLQEERQAAHAGEKVQGEPAQPFQPGQPEPPKQPPPEHQGGVKDKGDSGESKDPERPPSSSTAVAL